MLMQCLFFLYFAMSSACCAMNDGAKKSRFIDPQKLAIAQAQAVLALTEEVQQIHRKVNELHITVNGMAENQHLPLLQNKKNGTRFWWGVATGVTTIVSVRLILMGIDSLMKRYLSLENEL